MLYRRTRLLGSLPACLAGQMGLFYMRKGVHYITPDNELSAKISANSTPVITPLFTLSF